MAMSPLYPCGKSFSTGTHDEIMEKVFLFSAIIYGIMMESRLRISYLGGILFNRIENSIPFTVTMVIHKSCILIDTVGSSECGPK